MTNKDKSVLIRLNFGIEQLEDDLITIKENGYVDSENVVTTSGTDYLNSDVFDSWKLSGEFVKYF